MTPELTADSPGDASKQPPSTAGMTTKVVKGSMWTLGGSVAPLAVSFISTPFIIRFLGTESYGVLLLVGLIPTYFAFADFGMGVASTKFASEAYGQGDEKKEAEIVWTAAAIAAISALIVAVPIFLFSYSIVAALNVPEHLLSQASIALKITSGSFFLGILSSVLNSPMLARLRMDLNMLTSAVPKILLAVVTPFILYLGGGLVEAVLGALLVTVGILLVVAYFSARLLPRLSSTTFKHKHISPLIKFGGGLVIGGIAGIFLANLEKLILTRLVSVEALAFYSVAFTLAAMTTMFANAMIQSLGPAFVRLGANRETGEYDALFSRAMRLNLICQFPILMVLFVIARPFFTIWAGQDFGDQSTGPFYILLAGLVFNISAYIPHSAINAAGRTDVFAKLYWFELAFYATFAIVLVNWVGILGAALAYTLRAILDAFAIGWFARRITGATFRFHKHLTPLLLGVASLLPAVILTVYDNYSVWLIVLVPLCLASYCIVMWRGLVGADERKWITAKFV